MKAEQVLVDFCKNHTEEPFGRNLKRSEKFNICRYVKTQGETQLAEDVGQGNYMDEELFINNLVTVGSLRPAVQGLGPERNLIERIRALR